MAKRKTKKRTVNVAKNGGSKLLDISTLVERMGVRIDGNVFEIKNPDELPILSYQNIARQFQRLSELWGAEAVSEGDEQEMSNILDRICRRVLEAPDGVHEKLRDTARMRIVSAFMDLSPESLRLGRGKRKETAQTGET